MSESDGEEIVLATLSSPPEEWDSKAGYRMCSADVVHPETGETHRITASKNNIAKLQAIPMGGGVPIKWHNEKSKYVFDGSRQRVANRHGNLKAVPDAKPPEKASKEEIKAYVDSLSELQRYCHDSVQGQFPDADPSTLSGYTNTLLIQTIRRFPENFRG